MASSSVSQEDVETDFMLSCRRSRIRIARARNPPQHPTRLVTGLEEPETVEDRGKDRGRVGRLDRSKGKGPRDRRKLREKRRSTGVVHLQSTESTGGSTAEDDGEFSPSWEETRRNTVANESPYPESAKPEGRPFPSRRTESSPSDLEADDEDTQDCDSVSKLDREMASLELVTSTVSDKVTSTVPDQNEDNLTVALSKALLEIENLRHQLSEARREISVLKLEREALMMQQFSNQR